MREDLIDNIIWGILFLTPIAMIILPFI